MMTLIFVFLIHCTPASGSFAEKTEMAWVTRIARTLDRNELLVAEREFAALDVTERACQMELRQDDIPFSCFEFQARAKKLGVDVPEMRLDEKCRRAAQRFTGTELPPFQEISPHCRRTLEDRISLIRYRHGLE